MYRQRHGPRARQGQRISHVRVGVQAHQDRAHVRLQRILLLLFAVCVRFR